MKLITNRMAKAVLAVAGSLSLLQGVQAATVFAYTSRDLILCFRKTGATGGTTGPNDFQVNVGQASLYYGLKPGTNITVGGFTAGQLNNAFDDLNDLSWSAAACVPAAGDSGDPSYPTRTLWVSAPRINPDAQSSPWVRKSPSTQGTAGGQIKSILDNAVFYSGTVGSNALNNTPTAILVPVGSGHEFGAFMGSFGNYANNFQGNVENTTPPDFTTSGTPSRLDLYELRPDSTATQPPGKYLGYFELKNDGTVVFVANPWPTPTLTFNRAGGTNTLTFTTSAIVNGFTPQYKLYFTNAAGISTPTATWPFVSTNISGDGASHFFQDTSADSSRLYRLGIQ
jgi:hypothetical protein